MSRPLSPEPLPGFSLLPLYAIPYPIMRTLTPMSSEMSPVARASQALAQSIRSVPCGPSLTDGEDERQPAVHPGRSLEALDWQCRWVVVVIRTDSIIKELPRDKQWHVYTVTARTQNNISPERLVMGPSQMAAGRECDGVGCVLSSLMGPWDYLILALKILPS